MLKEKRYIIVLIAIMVAIIMLKPNFSNAATEYKYSDTEQGIEWGYELDENNNVINLYCATKTKIGKVEIPSTIDGKKVISLKGTENPDYDTNDDRYNSVFNNCKAVSEVIIPDTIAEIPDGAFYNCVGLKSITIPNTIVSIEYKSFEGCTGLTTITLPNLLTSVSSNAFYGCTGLKSVVLSENLIEIKSSAFRECTGLKEINLPSNLISIGSYAFKGCTGITKLEIPDSVTTMGNDAFASCTGIKELKLSKNLTKIADRTFYDNTGLKEVQIPDNVTTISASSGWASGAFEGCSNLEKVLIPDNVVTIDNSAFRECPKLTIYGNDGMKSKEYAKANEINFDYIANWDKANDGADVTPPSVEKIEVARDSIKNCTKDTNKNMYIASSGTTLTINVQFSEIVEGKTAPVLTIKFGDMDKIELTNGVIGGSIVSYNYTIKETDKGALTSVSLTGGDLKDSAGNVATLTVPAIYVQYSSAECVYANGTATVNPDNENKDNNKTDNNQKDDNKVDNNSKDENNKDNNNNNNNNNQANNNDKNNQQNSNNTNDDTKAKGELPHTGAGIGIVFILTFVTILCVIVRNKYNKLRDI